jgi:cytochrome d ubiquinol oxidase subunit II
LFGTCAAAVASGDIHVPHGNIPIALWGAWLTPFALDAGIMALAVCATLAAVYLTVEARMNGNEELANTFRLRAFIAEAFVGVFSLLGLFLSSIEAPLLWRGILYHALWAVGVTVILGAATVGALIYRRYKTARLLVIMEVGALLGTWGLAQLPYIVPPDLTIQAAASPPTTLWEFLASVAVGMMILLPSLWFLFHVFKGRNPVPPIHEKEIEGT